MLGLPGQKFDEHKAGLHRVSIESVLRSRKESTVSRDEGTGKDKQGIAVRCVTTVGTLQSHALNLKCQVVWKAARYGLVQHRKIACFTFGVQKSRRGDELRDVD